MKNEFQVIADLIEKDNEIPQFIGKKIKSA